MSTSSARTSVRVPALAVFHGTRTMSGTRTAADEQRLKRWGQRMAVLDRQHQTSWVLATVMESMRAARRVGRGYEEAVEYLRTMLPGCDGQTPCAHAPELHGMLGLVLHAQLRLASLHGARAQNASEVQLSAVSLTPTDGATIGGTAGGAVSRLVSGGMPNLAGVPRGGGDVQAAAAARCKIA